MSQTNAMTEDAFERYYAQVGERRNSGWLYVGFAGLLVAGLLTGMILDWSAGGDVGRLVPGGSGGQVFVVVLGMGMELKALEYVGLFAALVFVLISYAMASK